jgi:hypothetical protein
MSATSLMKILVSLSELWSEQTSAQAIAHRLGSVEHAPAARSLLVVRPSDPCWARAQVAVNDDGSAPWVMLDPVRGDSLTLGELRDVLGEPSEVMRIHWNQPEQAEFRYRRKAFNCSVKATLGDDFVASGRCITSVWVCPDRRIAPVCPAEHPPLY